MSGDTSAGGLRRLDWALDGDVRILSVSIDPEHDTPAVLRRYVAQRRFTPSFHFLTGTRAELRRAWSAYHVAVRPGPRGTVTHSTFAILIDPQGAERVLYGSTVGFRDLAADLVALSS